MPSSSQPVTARFIRELASECGLSLAGVVKGENVYDFTRYKHWIERGLAGQMGYLADHRAELRSNPSNLLHGARSVISVGLLYNGPEPCSTAFSEPDRAWISRYAWGEDYHTVLRAKLQLLDRKLKQIIEFTSRICVDTAPLLERSLARDAGLGWIGKNTCLINQQQGSWFFLGELITTLDIKPDSPPPDRCGTCTRCIDACPTDALTPYELDARLCISYFTIELRSSIPEPHREQMGSHIFGCDICQDVCPWNRRAPQDRDPAFAPTAFAPTTFAPDLARMAELSEQDFRDLFRRTPVSRAKYAGFLRNVAVAMGNAGLEKFREPLTKLAASPDPTIAEHAQWALDKIERN